MLPNDRCATEVAVMPHKVRHQGAPRFSMGSPRVCPEWSQKIADFSSELDDCGGLKNRRLHEKKAGSAKS